MSSIVFIDGQNLHLGVMINNWKIDLGRFRRYLLEKYKAEAAYYFLGYEQLEYKVLYQSIRDAGFILVFKLHHSLSNSSKKGNVDGDIIFEVMKSLVENAFADQKVVIVSGDGDYRKLVDYCISKGRFLKMLFPNKKFASSLYGNLNSVFYEYLDIPEIKDKIKYLGNKKD